MRKGEERAQGRGEKTGEPRKFSRSRLMRNGKRGTCAVESAI